MTDNKFNEELSQTRARIVISTLSLFGFGWLYVAHPEHRTDSLRLTLGLVAAYAVFGGG